MRVLFLSGWLPFPVDNGSKLRIANLLRGLAREHELTLITFADRPPNGEAAELRALCRDVQVVPRRPYRPTSVLALLGFLSPTPRSLVATHVPQMAACIRRDLGRRSYDLVIASQWSMAAYAGALGDAPALFEEVELGIFQARKLTAPTPLQRLRHQLPWLKLRFYVQRVLSRFQACTVVSEAERRLLRGLAPRYQAVELIPNCVNLADYADVRAAPRAGTLAFTGSLRYFANHDAMTWFLREIYPRVQAGWPGACLTITGDHADLPLPPATDVTRSGYLDDVRPLLASSWASVVPLRLGGGTRLKILEAMALRTPVVSTSKGAEGLDVRDEEHLLIADTPAAFAEAVVRLFREPALRQRLADNAWQLVREQYDWAAVTPRLLRLAERVARGGDAPPSLSVVR